MVYHVLFLMSAVAKERLPVAKSKKIVAVAQTRPGVERASRERDMGIPTGEMTASAGEQSELDDRTNKLQKDLSSDGYTVIRELLATNQVESLRLIVTQYLKAEGRYQYGGKFQLHASMSQRKSPDF